MESAAGPSNPSPYHRYLPEEAEEAKIRTIKVTMGGGLWTTSDMLIALIADSTLQDMATPFPDGRDGETNIFFVSFLSAETAHIVVDSVADSANLTAAMVTDDEFQVFQAIYRSSVEAAAAGYTAARKDCFSAGSSNSKPATPPPGWPHPEKDLDSENENQSSQDDEVETDREARAEGLGSDPHYEADGLEGIALGPPPKRRRLSLGGTDDTLPVVSDSQRLRDAVGTLIWAIGREFGSAPAPSDPSDPRNTGASGIDGPGYRTSGDYREGSPSPRLSSKAKGKRPMK